MTELQNPYLNEFMALQIEYTRAMGYGANGHFLINFRPTDADLNIVMNYFRTREALRHQYAYAIFTQTELELIKSHAPRLVSIGAGTGYVECLLSQIACEVIAFDETPYKNHWCDGNYFPISAGSANSIKDYPNHALFLCWPPYDDPMAYDALTTYQGNVIVYVGEGEGMATADDQFHEALESQWDLLVDEKQQHNWDGLHSRIFIYKRKENSNGS